jgi:hypothetical protein
MLVAMLLPGAGQEAKPQATTLREKGDGAIRARAILRKYCHECHGGDQRKGTITVMDHARLVATGPNPVPFVERRDPAKSQIIQLIEDGSMPPGGRPRPTRDEVVLLKQWIEDDATAFPTSFDDDATLQLLLDDAARRPADAAHMRYLSFSHLIRDDAPPTSLAAAERELFSALAACGLTEPPTPVDGPATLYRLDIRQAGWDSRDLFELESGGFYTLTPYDLVLLEYPHALALPGGHTLAKQLQEYLDSAKLTRPVPLLRADWVTTMLRKGTPLADDLKSLSELHAALRKREGAKLPCGPRPHAFGRLNPVPASPKAESPRTILPLSSWYCGDCQPMQPPFALTATLVDLDRKPIKSVIPGQPFQVRVNTDRPAHFALLMVWSNGQIAFQATQANAYLETKETFLRPPAGEKQGFTIADILTGENEATEYFVLFASPKALPRPVVVRSRHARGPACEKQMRYPIYRFVFGPAPLFDPSSVVRRVIPIPVVAAKDN